MQQIGAEAGRRELTDVVDGALTRGQLEQHPAHPGRELVAGAAPAHADEHIVDTRNAAEHEIVVGHQVVVALVDVGDLGDLRSSEARHALLDELGDAVDAGGAAVGDRHVRRVVVPDLHRVDQAVDDRMQVDAGVEVGHHRQDVRRVLVPLVVRRPKVLGIMRPVLGDGDLQGVTRQQREHVVGAVSGRDHQRSGEENPCAAGDPELLAVPFDARHGSVFVDVSAESGEAGAQCAGDGREVDQAADRVQVGQVRYQERVFRRHLGRGHPLDGHPEPRHHVRAEGGVGGGQVRGHGGLGDVHAAAAHQHVGSGGRLELVPQPNRLVGQSRVTGVEVVASVGPGPAVGRRRRVAHPSPLQHDHPAALLRSRPGGEHAHHAAADDEEIEDLARRPSACGQRTALGWPRTCSRPSACGRPSALGHRARPPEDRARASTAPVTMHASRGRCVSRQRPATQRARARADRDSRARYPQD